MALATAVPPVILGQDEVVSRAAEIFGTVDGGFYRLAPVYQNAAIERRHACTPIDWFLDEHGFAERNALFLENAVALLAEAAARRWPRRGCSPKTSTPSSPSPRPGSPRPAWRPW